MKTITLRQTVIQPVTIQRDCKLEVDDDWDAHELGEDEFEELCDQVGSEWVEIARDNNCCRKEFMVDGAAVEPAQEQFGAC